MKILKLRKKNSEELNINLINLLRTQLKFRMQIARGQIQQSHLIRQTRRDIARIKSLLNEK